MSNLLRSLLLFCLIVYPVYAQSEQSALDQLAEQGALKSFQNQLGTKSDIVALAQEIKLKPANKRYSSEWKVLALHAFTEGDYQSSVKYWRLYQSRQQQELIAKLLNYKGLYYEKIARYDEALIHYQESLDYAEQNHLDPFKLLTLSGIAKSLGQLNRYQEAIAAFDRFLSFYSTVSDADDNPDLQNEYQYALNKKAEFLLALNNTHQALETYQTLGRLHQQNQNIKLQLSALLNEALVLMQQGNYQQAIDKYDAILAQAPLKQTMSGLSIFENINLAHLHINALVNKTHVLGLMKRYDEALAIYESAKQAFFPVITPPSIYDKLKERIEGAKQRTTNIDDAIVNAYKQNDLASFLRLRNEKDGLTVYLPELDAALEEVINLAKRVVIEDEPEALRFSQRIKAQFVGVSGTDVRNTLLVDSVRLMLNYAITLYNSDKFDQSESIANALIVGFENNSREEIVAMMATLAELKTALTEKRQ